MADNAAANLDASKLRVFRTGNIWFHPDETTPAPTSADWTPEAGYKGLGYLGTGGLGESMSVDTSDIVVGQDNQTVDSYTTGSTHEFTPEYMETNKTVLETTLGATIDPATGGYTYNAGDVKPRGRYVTEWIDRRTGHKIVKSFIGQVTDPGATTYTTTDAVVLTPTIRAYGDITAFDTALIETAG